MEPRRRSESSEKRDHPYVNQPDRAFWRRNVEGVYPLDIAQWYKKKFSIAGRKLAAAGSCFAQHIGRELQRQGFPYLDVEPAPGFLPAELHFDYGYGIYSARYGNIYTSRQLLQLLQRALGEFRPVDIAWERRGLFVDPFRPLVEPDGLAGPEEVEVLRRHHLDRVIRLFEQTEVFVFTLGMTETWMSTRDGAVFPLAPGTAGGVYDPALYRFVNLTYPEILADLESVMARLRGLRADMRFLFTVSPVFSMATAGPHQVVVANGYSKSVLRAVAGHLADTRDEVDYFPSYDIVTAAPMRAMFYNPDMRTVSAHGVKHVMAQFFAQHAAPPGRVPVGSKRAAPIETDEADRISCDEEIAAVFGTQAAEPAA